MLTIRRTRVLRGPNIWAPVPVIVLDVAIGELEERLQRETPVFFERLIALLPSLETHAATVAQPELRLCPPPAGPDRPRRAAAGRSSSRTLPRRTRRTSPARTPSSTPTSTRRWERRPARSPSGSSTTSSTAVNQASPSPTNWMRRSSSRPNATPPARSSTPSWRRPSAAASRSWSSAPLRRSCSSAPAPISAASRARFPPRPPRSRPPSSAITALTRRLLHGAGLPVPRHVVVRDVDARRRGRRAPRLSRRPQETMSTQDPWPRRALESDAPGPGGLLGCRAREAPSGQVVVTRAATGTIYRILVVGDQVVAVAERVPARPGTAAGGTANGTIRSRRHCRRTRTSGDSSPAPTPTNAIAADRDRPHRPRSTPTTSPSPARRHGGGAGGGRHRHHHPRHCPVHARARAAASSRSTPRRTCACTPTPRRGRRAMSGWPSSITSSRLASRCGCRSWR